MGQVEIDFYDGFAQVFVKYMESYLGNGTKIYYSINKSLDAMLNEIQTLSNRNVHEFWDYVPKLKLDILFAIINSVGDIKFVLVEAKYLNQLSLKDYSQLAGYLQVAKSIKIGLLLLIQKGMSPNKLSNDFQEIVLLKKLPMNWSIRLSQFNTEYNFLTGIIYYMPNAGIEWIDSNKIHGISSFRELAIQLK